MTADDLQIHLDIGPATTPARLAAALLALCPELDPADTPGALVAAVRRRWPGVPVSLSPLPLGAPGSVAPAVLLRLTGHLWRSGKGAGLSAELADILAELAAPDIPAPEGAILAEGQDPDGTTRAALHLRPQADRIAWIAFDIDDMTGEEIGHACDHLRAVPGLVELCLFPGQGKKHRPVTRFELLVAPERLDAVIDAVFLQTTTLGLRHGLQARRVLPRWPSEGRAAKMARRPDGSETVKVEADGVAALPTLAARRAAARR